MTGTNSIKSAIDLKNDLIEILSNAGMKLGKWVSNYPEILEGVTTPSLQTSSKDVHLQETVSILGLKWSPEIDEFKFSVRLPDTFKITKRSILSEASQIFDPIGWLAPIIVRIKILYQSLWLIAVSWDDELPQNIQHDWKILRSELKLIEDITVKRWYETCDNTIELHGFGDASEQAYGAVVYIRAKSTSGDWNTTLVSAKTKVAPVKKLSIPRLELCASVLLVELMKMVKIALTLTIDIEFYWTDSTTVLGWLSSHPGRWSTFIANRTSSILQSTKRDQWFHVTSSNNPADVASRGMPPSELLVCKIWWNGPQWLSLEMSQWPKQQHYTTDVEQKKNLAVLTVSSSHGQVNVIEELVKQFSNLHKIIKILAWCLRFINNCKLSSSNILKRKKDLMEKAEVNHATILILKWSQQIDFNSEILDISKQQTISKTSKILSLNPFIDCDGLLRVGGRLANALIPYDTKHQVILSAKSPVAKLLIQEYHHRFYHAGSSLLLNILRHKYWIIRCKDLIRNVIKNCVQCFRSNPQTEEQQMGNLPPVRVDLVRPFVKVGCDFCGPIQIYHKRSRGQRPFKSYICVFVCMSTKAIHLELVCDLTSESFLAALRRLTSRRGPCSDIYSDCGTNFVGANNELKEVINFLKLNNDNIYYSLLKESITWHFNPPASPHQGGLWESMVKIVKTHLRRTTGDHTLTMEEIQTFLCEIENVVNSRPLCVLSNDKIEALTPAHFLFHHASTYIPDYNYDDEKINKLSKWQIVQKLVQHFWRRWYNEYLTLLQNRSKWTNAHPNIEIGDIVIIKDENMPPTKWKLARVESTVPGNDNLVRIAKLKTESGYLTRPIQKLCKLPVN